MSKICANCGVLNRSELIRCKKCNCELAGGGLKAWEQGGYQKRESTGRERPKIPLYSNLKRPPAVEAKPPPSLGEMIDTHLHQVREKPSSGIVVEEYVPASSLSAASGNKRVYGIIFSVTLIIAFVFSGVYFLNNRESYLQADRLAQALEKQLAEGEAHLDAQNYPAAMDIFRSVIDQTNDSELTIRATSLLRDASGRQISFLLVKAENAFQNNRILTADDDNAIRYLREIFAINPREAAAEKIRYAIERHLSILASTAEKSKQFNNALSYYETMLLLNPDDVFAQSNVERILLSIQHQRISKKKVQRSQQEKQNSPDKPLNMPGDNAAKTESKPAFNKQNTDNLQIQTAAKKSFL